MSLRNRFRAEATAWLGEARSAELAARLRVLGVRARPDERGNFVDHMHYATVHQRWDSANHDCNAGVGAAGACRGACFGYACRGGGASHL